MTKHAKVFRSGNSQAVRLPKELRLDADEVSISRHGDALILRPLSRAGSLVAAFDALAGIEGDFLPEGRQQGTSEEREAF
ncbi:MAG: antitoxin [Deinococcus sp.]